MEPSNRICPFCGKGNVWYLEDKERCNQNDLYCKDCYMKFSSNNSDIFIKIYALKGMDYSISWEYIVNKMKEKGIEPDSAEKHPFHYFEQILQEIWNEFFNKKYAIEISGFNAQKGTTSV